MNDMKALFPAKMYLFSCLLLAICFSCSKSAKEVETLFNQVESIVGQQPDSALALLNTILFPEDLKESRYNQFLLLQIQAKDKSYQDITSDTIIFKVKEYYIQKNDYPNASLAAYYCGRLLHEQKKVVEACKAYLEAEKLANPIKNDNLKGLIQSNLSILYEEQRLKDEAIVRAKNAIPFYDKAKNHKNKIETLLLIGNCFLLDNKMDSAFHYYHESLHLADYYKIPEEQAKTRQCIGVAYRQAKMYPEAKKMFREALSFPIDSIEQARLYMNLAKVFNFENRTDSAKFYATQSLNFEAKEPALLLSTYSLLSKIEEKLGHYKETLQYHKKYSEYIIEVVEDNENKALLGFQKKYDFESVKNERNQLAIEKQQIKVITIISIIVIFISSLIGFLFYRKSVRKDKLVLEGMHTIESLEGIVRSYSENGDSIRSILLHHFNILKKVGLIEKTITEDDKRKGSPMIRKIRKIVYEQDSLDWDKMYQIINQIQNGLFDRVRERYPELNSKEFRICYLSCGDLSDDEISTLLGDTSKYMVEKIRSNIRKKIGVPSHGNIYDFFIKNCNKE